MNLRQVSSGVGEGCSCQYKNIRESISAHLISAMVLTLPVRNNVDIQMLCWFCRFDHLLSLYI